MVQTLDRMFSESSNIARHASIGALINTHMTRENVRDHCLKMMGHINTAEVMSSLNVVETCLVEKYNDNEGFRGWQHLLIAKEKKIPNKNLSKDPL